jgi:hypothetical protein
LSTVQGLRKQSPGLRLLESRKYLFEKLVEALEHADAIKHVVYDVEPPQSFRLLDRGRFCRGKDRRRRIAERTGKGGFDGD